MKIIVLDTSFISSLYFENDSNHKTAKEMMWSVGDEEAKFVVPFVVAAELSIANLTNINLVEKALILVPDFTMSTMADIEFIKSLDKIKRASLKANDCLVFAMAARLNAKLWTFDQKLLQIYKSL